MEQNKTVMESMKENGSIIVLYKKEIRKAQAMLIAGEDVRCAISGALYIDTAGEQPDTKRKTVDSNSGVLVLTDRRLFFVGFFGVLNMELDIGALRSVEAFDDRGLRAMRIFTEEGVLRFRDKRQCIAAMVRDINKALGIEVEPEEPKPEEAAAQPSEDGMFCTPKPEEAAVQPRKTVMEAMKENGSIIVLYKKEIRKAQAMLIAGEDVRCAISGALYIDTAGEQPDTKKKTVESNGGVLVLTDRRLLFVGNSGYLNMELDIGDLHSVEAFDDGYLRAMRIFTEKGALRFRDKRQCIAAMVRAINKALGIEMPPEDPKPEKTARQPKARKFRTLTPAEIRCPNCGSLRHRVYKYPKSNPYFIRNSTILFLRLLLRIYTVFILEGKTLECCDCGCCWRP